MRRCRRIVWVAAFAASALAVSAASAQRPVARPQPPPSTPGVKAPATPAKPGPTTSPAPPAPQPAGAERAAPAVVAPPQASARADSAPSASQLHNIQVFPSAQYLESYDAGQGQTFYLYGCTRSFGELVAYYRTVLKDKGELVFDAPATHMFEIGKYKETEVAFPPGVTVKDYTWGGSPGYMNPRPGASPAYFPTVIQVVPPPSAPADRRQ